MICKIVWMVLPSSVGRLPVSVSLSTLQSCSIPLSDVLFHGLNFEIKPPRSIVKYNVFILKFPFLHNEFPYLTVKCCSVWTIPFFGGKQNLYFEILKKKNFHQDISKPAILDLKISQNCPDLLPQNTQKSHIVPSSPGAWSQRSLR